MPLRRFSIHSKSSKRAPWFALLLLAAWHPQNFRDRSGLVGNGKRNTHCKKEADSGKDVFRQCENLEYISESMCGCSGRKPLDLQYIHFHLEHAGQKIHESNR